VVASIRVAAAAEELACKQAVRVEADTEVTVVNKQEYLK
jgi:hypothetical protein